MRVTRVMMETSPREEGDDGHNNQLGTKAAATARTVVAKTARATMTAARVMVTGAKKGDGKDGNDGNDGNNGNDGGNGNNGKDDAKWRR